MKLQPIIYFPHGAGPLPLLGEPQHENLVKFFESLSKSLEKPKCILLISAHWEEDVPTINNAAKPSLLYDYHGFPPASYQLSYSASGSPSIAQSVFENLEKAGIKCNLNHQRGWDHGVFVPLKLMYPNADIPCVQLSLVQSMDPAIHINIGQALAGLRQQGVLILGSGSSFHNMTLIHGVSPADKEKSIQFDRWLTETCLSEALSKQDKIERLLLWKQAPFAEFSHPREEHLLPLFVCVGATLNHGSSARKILDEIFMGVKVSSFRWD